VTSILHALKPLSKCYKTHACPFSIKYFFLRNNLRLKARVFLFFNFIMKQEADDKFELRKPAIADLPKSNVNIVTM
jgi:hypothetical protein